MTFTFINKSHLSYLLQEQVESWLPKQWKSNRFLRWTQARRTAQQRDEDIRPSHERTVAQSRMRGCKRPQRVGKKHLERSRRQI